MIQAVTPYILQNLIWIPTQFFLRIFARFDVRGIENLKEIRGGVIFVSNHTSELDPILLPASFSLFSRFLPMFYVSREKSFYNPTFLKRLFYGGFFFELWGAHQTDAGLNNYKLSLKNHIEILRRGNSLLVFPEGDKSFDGSLHEFKGGAAYLSHTTGSPIVPVAIKGVFNTSPGSFFTLKHRVTLSFGKPIYPNDFFTGKTTIEPHDYKIAMNQVVMKELRTLLASSH